jgi:hypothetical protein
LVLELLAEFTLLKWIDNKVDNTPVSMLAGEQRMKDDDDDDVSSVRD